MPRVTFGGVTTGTQIGVTMSLIIMTTMMMISTILTFSR